MLDLSQLPVVDIHAHPFLDAGSVSVEQFTNLTAFGGGSVEYMEEGGAKATDALVAELLRGKQETLYFKRLLLDLAAFHDVEPNVHQVVAARNAAVTKGYTEYVSRLYRDAGITSIIFDFGYPLPSFDVAEVSAQLPIKVVPIYRIEPLIVELLATDLSWQEFSRAYDDAIGNALTTGGYRGLKSVIAYRTGLEVSPLSRTPDQGYQALDSIRRGLGGGSMKKLRDHLLCRALELCIEHDVPMQIHTGMGDFEVNLPLCRPGFLMDLLRFPAYRACHVILVHAGYPYHREAAYMANVLPRVYIDVSEGIPFASTAAWEIYDGVLSMTPVSKVCYGSDGYKLPEIIYSSAKLGKQALADVLQKYVDRQMMTQADALSAAAAILAGNSSELYKIG